jgi:hypothetical protein
MTGYIPGIRLSVPLLSGVQGQQISRWLRDLGTTFYKSYALELRTNA